MHVLRSWLVLVLLLTTQCTPAFSSSSLQEAPTWKTLAPGLEIAEVQTVPVEEEPSSLVQMIRLDPSHWQLSARHYKDEGLAHPPNLESWVQKTESPVVFNAGYYYEDFRHIGLLLRDGKNLGTRLHPKWKGLLVSGPKQKGHLPLNILDLLEQDFSTENPPYQVAVQSLMILKDGKKRVARTERLASRTAVALDKHGRLIVFWTEGLFSLWRLADILDQSGLQISRALTLDGGREAQVAIEAEQTHIRRYGMSAIGAIGLIQGPVPLPAVVIIEPVSPKPTRP